MKIRALRIVAVCLLFVGCSNKQVAIHELKIDKIISDTASGIIINPVRLYEQGDTLYVVNDLIDHRTIKMFEKNGTYLGNCNGTVDVFENVSAYGYNYTFKTNVLKAVDIKTKKDKKISLRAVIRDVKKDRKTGRVYFVTNNYGIIDYKLEGSHLFEIIGDSTIHIIELKPKEPECQEWSVSAFAVDSNMLYYKMLEMGGDGGCEVIYKMDLSDNSFQEVMNHDLYWYVLGQGYIDFTNMNSKEDLVCDDKNIYYIYNGEVYVYSLENKIKEKFRGDDTLSCFGSLFRIKQDETGRLAVLDEKYRGFHILDSNFKRLSFYGIADVNNLTGGIDYLLGGIIFNNDTLLYAAANQNTPYVSVNAIKRNTIEQIQSFALSSRNMNELGFSPFDIYKYNDTIFMPSYNKYYYYNMNGDSLRVEYPDSEVKAIGRKLIGIDSEGSKYYVMKDNDETITSVNGATVKKYKFDQERKIFTKQLDGGLNLSYNLYPTIMPSGDVLFYNFNHDIQQYHFFIFNKKCKLTDIYAIDRKLGLHIEDFVITKDKQIIAVSGSGQIYVLK